MNNTEQHCMDHLNSTNISFPDQELISIAFLGLLIEFIQLHQQEMHILIEEEKVAVTQLTLACQF